MASDQVVLSDRDVVLVRRWYEGDSVAAIGRALGVSRQRAGELLAGLRARGLPLTPRATGGARD